MRMRRFAGRKGCFTCGRDAAQFGEKKGAGFQHSSGYPNSWMVYKGNSTKMDDLGVPPFQKTPI